MEPNDSTPRRPRCFVVIGFGVKTDLATGRAINLDKTFEELIRPALDAAGIDGFRAIDINRSGTIDSIMYRWLYEAEVVVADLSTLNANVLYEVGVRHALKPNTTILIAESVLLKSLPFDLSHTIVHAYQLEGDAPKEEEKLGFRENLTKLLRATMAEPQQDSPVYDFLPGMVAPQRAVPADDESEVVDLPLAAIMSLAALARNKGDLQRAGWLYGVAVERNPSDQYLRRQLASVLSERAAGQPDEEEARRDLEQAESVMEASDPASSTDPQVLCTAGDINRGLYEKTRDVQYLQKAAWHYTRAFYIRQGPAQGIEGAKLHAEVALEEKRAKRDHPAVQSAVAVCAAVASVCRKQTTAPGFDARQDRGPVYTSMAQAYLGMGKFNEARALFPAIEAANGRRLTWDAFVAENRGLSEIGRTVSSSSRANLLWGAGGAAAAVLITLLISQWSSDRFGGRDGSRSDALRVQGTIRDEKKSSQSTSTLSERDVRSSSELAGKQPGGPEFSTPAETPPGSQALGGRQTSLSSSAELRPLLAPLLSSLSRTELKLDQMAGPLTDIRDSTSRVSGLPSRVESMDQGLNKSIIATQNSVLAALERNSRMASGCSENTAAILQLANILVDQTKRINNELQQVSKTARSAPRSGGPHIQFDALRPGLAEGFAYPLEDGENPIRELGLSLTLNSKAAGGPAVTVREYRTGRKTDLVRAGLDRDPQVRFRGVEVGEYCSLLTLNRDPRTSRWLGIVRMREGCGDSCASGCGVQ